MKQLLMERISAAIASAQEDKALPAFEWDAPEVLEPQQEAHGDYSTNIAMRYAKQAGMTPHKLAFVLVEYLQKQEQNYQKTMQRIQKEKDLWLATCMSLHCYLRPPR